MVPPICSVSRLQIARPRPEPPKRRLIELSAWTNSPNKLPIRSAAMPMPVSWTDHSTVMALPSRAMQRAAMVTVPASVNFTALETRLSKT